MKRGRAEREEEKGAGTGAGAAAEEKATDDGRGLTMPVGGLRDNALCEEEDEDEAAEKSEEESLEEVAVLAMPFCRVS